MNYRLSNVAKQDLIRIHQYGVRTFGMKQADKYIDTIFDCFEVIAKYPFSFESVDYVKMGYRRCPCGSDTIYYKVNGDVVDIMAIVGMQDLKNVF